MEFVICNIGTKISIYSLRGTPVYYNQCTCTADRVTCVQDARLDGDSHEPSDDKAPSVTDECEPRVTVESVAGCDVMLNEHVLVHQGGCSAAAAL